ncbi:alpha-glucuronidase [Streptococcus sp. S784/96/1]|uniref:alpha-glucuronidase n=1 Tax=Streptococcus sp. S784/96/1 TaxID=2653499 RepID=UPI0013870510|nr:alpha-glucuronidase [Streptococcus sp. S784/96/1]
MTRDKAWLSKKIKTSIRTVQLKNLNDNLVKQTIIDEVGYLFDGISVISSQADLVLEVDVRLGLAESYSIDASESNIRLIASDNIGLLYGIYRLHRDFIVYGEFRNVVESPKQAIRMINHWDNMDGSIERGYAGESIFFKDNHFRRDFTVIREYARLLASVGINALSINNVNVHKVETELITEKFLPELKYVASLFESYGIKIFLSINFASPKIIGGLETADPLDEGVVMFWKERVEQLYKAIPSFGGFVVKADSEGEPGPFAYGRTHKDGANMFGKLLAPYNGLCVWRCFVYNSTQDWRDRSTDRARAAYDHFMAYDGEFLDNVILQIKLGPLDFQVKEPVSPLFGGLRKTNQIIEFQLTQEYTGQQKAIYYQVPVWKEALDFDTRYDELDVTLVKDVIKQYSQVKQHSGICAVGVVGMDDNWTGLKLMQINLYAYGMLAWNSDYTTEDLAKQWIALTFDLDKEKQHILSDILCTSRETYQLYNAPFGVGFMCRPNHHYGPDVNGYEFDRWGTYHFADRNGVGVDRTINGTGYVTQYSQKNMELYNHVKTCPEDLLLWFHHVSYEYVMENGKTLIQNIYDNHFEGVNRVEAYIEQWEKFKGFVSESDFSNVRERLLEQYRLAIEWRDQINTYFYRLSGIEDDQQRLIYR